MKQICGNRRGAGSSKTYMKMYAWERKMVRVHPRKLLTLTLGGYVQRMSIMKLCGVCNKPIEKEWPHRHDYHEYDCPNFVDFVANPDAGSPNYPCDCDLVAHPECCPQCNKSRPTTVATDALPCGHDEGTVKINGTTGCARCGRPVRR